VLNIFLVIGKKENLVTNHFLISSRYIVVYRRHNRDSLQFLSKRSALSAAKLYPPIRQMWSKREKEEQIR